MFNSDLIVFSYIKAPELLSSMKDIDPNLINSPT